MSLYTKHRPKTNEGMKGNFSAIEKKLELPDHNHVFLFTGPSGCGKTSESFIVASLVGAEDGDVVYINAADSTGIDDMRSLLRDLMLSPTGKARVYIIDEFHKVSVPAQSTLLIPLEDTPDHVYFILCSSEPKHIIKAIRTRASTFDFPPLTASQLYSILRDINKAEGFSLDKGLLMSIAEKAEGSARTAINILEDVSGLSPSEQEEAVEKLSGGIDDAETIDLCRQLYARNSWSEWRKTLSSLKENGKEPESIRRALLGYGQSMLLSGGAGDDSVAGIMGYLVNTVYDSGFPGLTLACYTAWAKNIRGF